MLTNNDLSQIRQVVKEELDTKLKHYPTKKDMEKDHNRIAKDIKISVNHLDKLYLNHEDRLRKIEVLHNLPSPLPTF